MTTISSVGSTVSKVYDIATDGNGFLGLEIYSPESAGIRKRKLIGVNVVQGWYLEATAYTIDYETKSYEMRAAPYTARQVFTLGEDDSYSQVDEQEFYELLDQLRSEINRHVFPANAPF